MALKIGINTGKLVEDIIIGLIAIVILIPIVSVTIGAPSYLLVKHTSLSVDVSMVVVLTAWMVLLLLDDYIEVKR